MMAQEQDSDLVQWGLRIFDGPYGDPTQHDMDILYSNHFSDNYYVEHRNVENDEMLARTLELEEGLSQLAITEASEFSHAVEEHPVPLVEHDWQIPAIEDNYCEQGYIQEAVDDVRPASSCSSPEENSNGDEYSCLLELTDESSLDGEVSRRLNQMFPVPHVPRINGEIPSTDEATSDYERLLNRLECRGLVELKVQGDGNCQFRALSDQFYRTPEHHKFVRRQVVNQLKSHPEVYEGYVPMAFSDYLKKISKNGEWGDHVTLQAAADSYGVKIVVITSFKDTCYIEILPEVLKSKRVICLSFWAEVHYNSIYPQEDFPSDLPSTESKKKKKWWSFGNKN